MIYKTKDIELGSKWACAEYGIIEVNEYDIETICFTSAEGKYGEYDFIEFIQLCRPYKEISRDYQTLNSSGSVVGKLLNDDEVTVVITDGAYKGGHTTKVKYELADFMDDEPPFMEILFVDKYDDTVYFTADMSEPVYELNGLLVVIGKGGNI